MSQVNSLHLPIAQCQGSAYQYITLAQIKLKTVGGNSITESIIGSPPSPRKAATVIPLALNRKLCLRSILFSVMKQSVSLCSFRKNCKIKKITSHPSLFCSTDNREQCFGTLSETHLHPSNTCVHTHTVPVPSHGIIGRFPCCQSAVAKGNSWK